MLSLCKVTINRRSEWGLEFASVLVYLDVKISYPQVIVVHTGS